ncbi:hypothetical protein MC885_016682, partial [Smutsia gigantea]
MARAVLLLEFSVDSGDTEDPSDSRAFLAPELQLRAPAGWSGRGHSAWQ